MASRGAVSKNGHITTNEYETVYLLDDAKVLKGITSQQHGLPDYSHTKNRKYIKENSDGSFRQMRIYGENHMPSFEIAYHPEENLTGNRHENVLHYHIYHDLNRSKAMLLTKEDNLYQEYKRYLEEYGL